MSAYFEDKPILVAVGLTELMDYRYQKRCCANVELYMY
jgi:hypothetical protein